MIHSPTLTVLGSGTSAGIPVIGCDCATCRSDDPCDRRLRTSGFLRFVDPVGQERVILIDTSPDLREQALRARLHRCDAILFTHDHVDHTFGLDEVRRFNAMMKAPIDIYADRRTLLHLQRVYQHIFERDRNVNDSFVATLVPRVVEPLEPIAIHGMLVTPVPLLHGNLPVLGYRFDAIRSGAAGSGSIGPSRRAASEQPVPLPLAWCTDCSAIPPETWRHLAGMRTLVLDMLRYRKHPTHFSVDEAVNVAAQVAAERTWFVHMTHDIRHAELDERLPGGMRLAWDGLVVGGGGV